MTSLANRRPSLWRIVVTVCFAALIFAIDVSIPLGVAKGMMYVLLVFVTFLFADLRYPIPLAVAGTCLALIGYAFSPQLPEGISPWIPLCDRAIAIVAMWAMVIPSLIHNRVVRRLERSEERSRAILENAGDGILTLDVTGKIESLNPSVQRLFGFTGDELPGKNVASIIPATSEARQAQLSLISLQAVATSQETLFARRKDGSLFPIELTVSEMTLDGQIKYLCMIRDISKRRHAEEERDKIERIAAARERLALLGELAAGIAHEFRNPLHGVSNCVQIIRSKMGHDVTMQKWLDLQDDGLRRMEVISGRLLRFGRDDIGPKRPVSPAEVILGAVTLVQARAEKEGISLTSIVSPDLPRVPMDGERVSEAILNLLTNALDACPPGGKVTVNAAMMNGNPEFMEIVVSDNGSGIPEDVMKHIFEPFFTTKPIGKGSGLGLALVKKIVEQHGGTLELNSKPNLGTSVCLRLPISDRTLNAAS